MAAPRETSRDGLRIAAPAKINLRLRITGRRGDGYHLLDSIVVPLSLSDTLEVAVSPASLPTVKLHCEHPALRTSSNLVVRAVEAFQRWTGLHHAVSVRLEKNIPLGAGLGGGSSDAAAVLLALNRLLPAGRRRLDLFREAIELGADVPFFLRGVPARVTGIGERLTPFRRRFPPWVVVARGRTPLDTRAVYQAYDRSLTTPGVESRISLSALGRMPLEELLVNDLEEAAARILPEIRTLKDRLAALGASGALMTGSGSAVFGLWEERKRAESAVLELREEGFWAKIVRILDRSPRISRL
jgi:4-diphosphocytidyl-2-C-methyl-D-erythritol kinase